MMKVALAAVLSIGLAAPVLAAQEPDTTERPDIPEEGEATLADCRVWIDHLGELIEEADPPLEEDMQADAEQRRDEASQACDDGNYHEGITTAVEAVDMIEGEGQNAQ